MTTTPTPSPRLSLTKAHDRRWPDPCQRYALSGQLHAITHDWRLARSWMAAAPSWWDPFDVLAAAQRWTDGVARVADAYPRAMTCIDPSEALAWMLGGFKPEQAVLSRALVGLNNPTLRESDVRTLRGLWLTTGLPADWVVLALAADLKITAAMDKYEDSVVPDLARPTRRTVDPEVVGTLELYAAIRGVDVRNSVIDWSGLSGIDL